MFLALVWPQNTEKPHLPARPAARAMPHKLAHRCMISTPTATPISVRIQAYAPVNGPQPPQRAQRQRVDFT
ncbi:hypothetical protein AD944_00745 [Acetobacter tropicalis]|nr:hypothetical protein AD944_00745 [Acetobacter tropicalis]